jgi:hypothetical protein
MIKRLALFSFLALWQFSCRQSDSPDLSQGPHSVRLVHDDSGYHILKNGKRVFIKGALGHSHLRQLKAIGGNTINVYNEYLSKELFAQADSLGLYVAVTLNLGRPFQGADYSDKSFVGRQRERVDSIVNLYKNEPALLFWVIGNEMHLELDLAPDVWKEINTLSKRIHELDPGHLTTTNIAGFDRKQLVQAKYFCNDIDFLSFNAHHRNYVLQRETRNILWGWEGAYLITEWTGPVYWHEMPNTSWGAPVEPNSSVKAEAMAHNYHIAIERDSTKCLGGFVFYWGEKQERTHTMFSLILDGKYKTPGLEVLQYFWQKQNPANYAPRIKSFQIDNEQNPNAIQLRRSSVYDLVLNVYDAEGDSLKTKIELYKEGDYAGIFGGDFEKRPARLLVQTFDGAPEKIPFTPPQNEGPYRVFVYVYDKESVSTANIPFYVLPM